MAQGLKWYFAVTQETLGAYQEMIRVAVHSASIHTNLRPHFLFDGEDCDFTREMQEAGVEVIFHRISFYKKLQSAKDKFYPQWDHYMSTAAGAFLRLDIPLIETEDEFVLYTDCDVMFTGPIDLGRYRPSIFMAAPQFDPRGHSSRELNSGVMVINVPRLGRDLPAIVDHGCDLLPGMNLGYDQDFLIEFYRGAWDPLALRYNWKPYWGINEDAKIIHWHGLKPEVTQGLRASEEFPTIDLFRTLFTSNRESYFKNLKLWEAFSFGANLMRESRNHRKSSP